MIQTGSIEQRSVSFRVLSDDQIEEIKRAAFEVMAKVGYRIHHEGARKMLKQAGALVNGEIVKVPEHVVLLADSIYACMYLLLCVFMNRKNNKLKTLTHFFYFFI